MAEIGSSTIHLAHRLVEAVARAFYTDSEAVILDALIRETYIAKEEFAPRLKLPVKEVERILRLLEDSNLVKCQDLTVEDRHLACYYIDFQSFTNVVRYRIYLMDKDLTEREREDVMYECPSCGSEFSSLEIMSLRTRDNCFACSHCCTSDDIRSTMSESRSRLRRRMSTDVGSYVSNMKLKMQGQLSSSVDHEGIYELLQQLKDKPLPRNLPSENRKRGLQTSRADDETNKEIDEKTAHRKVRQAAHRIGDTTRDRRDTSIEIELVEDASDSINAFGTTALLRSKEEGEEMKQKSREEMELRAKEESLPSFMRDATQIINFQPKESSPPNIKAGSEVLESKASIPSQPNPSAVVIIGEKGGVDAEGEDDEDSAIIDISGLSNAEEDIDEWED